MLTPLGAVILLLAGVDFILKDWSRVLLEGEGAVVLYGERGFWAGGAQ